MTQTLFDYAAKGSSVPDARIYPSTPGSKKSGTSQLAAQSVKAKSLREKVLLVLRNTEATADECASRLGEVVLAVRPRVSELIAQGKVIEVAQRRKNRSGKLAQVWRAI